MSNNKNIKEELIRRYGLECFIEKLKLRNDIEPRKYTGKGQRAKMKQLTYHHIKMKKDGGKATVENGALLSAENHQWFHKQNPLLRSQMNNLFQEYKRQYDECRVVFVDNLDFDFEVRATEFHIDEKEIKQTYNRAKEKQELRKRIDEEFSR